MKQRIPTHWFQKPIKAAYWATFVLLSGGLSTGLSAQTISPSTINSGGQSIDSGSPVAEWSIGEATAITTMQTNNLIVTNGVLQDYSLLPTVAKTVATNEDNRIRVYPIPAIDFLEINMPNQTTGTFHIEVLDMRGVRVMNTQFEFSEQHTTEKLSMSELASGNYLLIIEPIQTTGKKTYSTQTFNIIKIY